MSQPQTAEELTNLTSSELLERLDEIRDAAIRAGNAWAEAEKTYNDLKEMMPSFLAEYQMNYSSSSPTVTAARVRALADKEYRAKITAMNKAEYEARLKEVEYKSWNESLKVLTSISYLRNSELKLR